MAGERRQGRPARAIKAREVATAERVAQRGAGQLTTERAHRCGEAERLNADHLAVGGRVREGSFVALVWFVGEDPMRRLRVVAGAMVVGVWIVGLNLATGVASH
jgi:hypothetical protein